MAVSTVVYEENIRDKLSLNIQFLNPTEVNEFNRIVAEQIKPAFLEEAEKCRWNEIHAKRKEKGDFSRESSFKNKYGIDYKRREEPFFILGINECMQELKNENLRILLYNKIGVRYCLGDSLLALCLSKHIPIIPLKLDQTALFNLTTDSKKPITVRTTCIGITKKTPPSRSLLSSLLFLEQYYVNSPHVSFRYSCPSHFSQSKQVSNDRTKQSRSDRERERHMSVFDRVDVKAWTGSKTQWIQSVQIQKKPRLLDVEQKEEPLKTLPAKEVEVEVVKKIEKKEGIEKKVREPPKSTAKKASLKDRLKSNPLFRFK